MKEIKLNVGTNFNIKQLEYYNQLNKKYEHIRIDSVFGSLKTSVLDIKSARPDYRIANTDSKEFEKYVQLSRDYGIEVEYAANASLYTSIDELHKNSRKIIDDLKYIENIGVARIIVSNPIMMELISNHTNLKQKISTIVGVNKTDSIKYYSNYNVDRICTDIYSNRNLPLLASMQKEAEKHSIEIELLANEICFYGDVPCSNMIRSSCYQHSSMGGNKDKLFNNWPFSRCQGEREKHPICWLKIPCILPQHIEKYTALTEISRFKISGRTNSWKYLSWIVEKYMSKQFTGSISNLFMLPQNSVSVVHNNFDIEELEKINFFDRWLNEKKGCDYNCDSCRYCEHIYEKL